jgi:hypothetical protein
MFTKTRCDWSSDVCSSDLINDSWETYFVKELLCFNFGWPACSDEFFSRPGKFDFYMAFDFVSKSPFFDEAKTANVLIFD